MKKENYDYISVLNKELSPPQEFDFTVLDLFAGCGGLSLGFEAAGFKSIGIEMDKDCCETYNKNLKGECINDFITKDKFSGKLCCANKKCKSFDVVSYGDSKIVSIWKALSQRSVMMDIRSMQSKKEYLNYLLKYVSANEMHFISPLSTAEYINYSRKKRLIQPFGCFFGMIIKKYKIPCPICNSLNTDITVDQEVINRILETRSHPPPKYWF